MSPAPGCSRLSKACDQLEHDVGVAPARLHGRARARSPRPRHDRVARSRIATGADGVFHLLARRVVVGEVDDTIALAAPDVQPDPRVAEGRQRERLHPGPARLIPARELPVQRGSGAVLREAARERGRQSGEARGRGAPRVDQPVREQPPYALAETHRGPLRAPSHVVVPRVGRTEDDRPAIARPRALVGIPQERALPVQAVEKLGQERGGRELGVVGRRAEDGEDNEHGIAGQPVGDPTDRRVHRAVDVVEPRPVSPGHGQPRHRMPGVENVPEVLAGGVGLRHDGDRLSDAERTRIAAWLAGVNGKRFWYNNWLLFQVIVNAFLKSVGAPYRQDEIDGDLDAVDSWYRRDGWYTDGPGANYDYYVGWAIHFYTLIGAGSTVTGVTPRAPPSIAGAPPATSSSTVCCSPPTALRSTTGAR